MDRRTAPRVEWVGHSDDQCGVAGGGLDRTGQDRLERREYWKANCELLESRRDCRSSYRCRMGGLAVHTVSVPGGNGVIKLLWLAGQGRSVNYLIRLSAG